MGENPAHTRVSAWSFNVNNSGDDACSACGRRGKLPLLDDAGVPHKVWGTVVAGAVSTLTKTENLVGGVIRPSDLTLFPSS